MPYRRRANGCGLSAIRWRLDRVGNFSHECCDDHDILEPAIELSVARKHRDVQNFRGVLPPRWSHTGDGRRDPADRLANDRHVRLATGCDPPPRPRLRRRPRSEDQRICLARCGQACAQRQFGRSRRRRLAVGRPLPGAGRQIAVLSLFELGRLHHGQKRFTAAEAQ